MLVSLRRGAARVSKRLGSHAHALRISSQLSYPCANRASLALLSSSIRVLAPPTQRRRAEPSTGQSQSLASSIARRVFLRARVRFLRAQTLRLACWVIFLRACPAQRVPMSLFRAWPLLH